MTRSEEDGAWGSRTSSHTADLMQDVLVVTAPGSGAEIIPYLKTYVNLPLAMIFTVMYGWVRL
jgi:ATP/ADP translocase